MSQRAGVPGIDTPMANYVALLKVDIDSHCQQDAITGLQTLDAALAEFVTLHKVSSKEHVSSRCCDTTAVVGFSARFFKGLLTQKRDTRAHATRFAITAPVPPDLKRMDAKFDDRFSELCTDALLGDKESDLIIICEADNSDRLNNIVTHLQALEGMGKLTYKTTHWGQRLIEKYDHLGFKDGISNLQDVREQHPNLYRRYIYVHHGEAGSPAYDGGTYLVFRKYKEHLKRWFDDGFCCIDKEGCYHSGVSAREHTIGRSYHDQLVIDHQTGEHLKARFDEIQGIHAFDESHIRQANPHGKGKTNFGAPILVKDARILRRSFPFTDVSTTTGEITQGLLFLCFQSNIQQRGFEFIHNEWLMSEFMGSRDLLLDPESGIIEPIDGCYYFIPPVHTFPGDVFF